MEGFFGMLKRERVNRRIYPTRREARADVGGEPRSRISPQTLLGFSCSLLQPFEHRISRHVLPIPPAPAVFD
jgi:hypothetical protein